MDVGELHRELVRERALVLVQILVKLVVDLVSEEIPKDPQPYHTSALSGEGWLVELILGHPRRIRCELGMSVRVFKNITLDLRSHGHRASKHVSLEEQLAIFLYTCVTGLPIRHVGERFQRSNDTISRYFRKMVAVFASEPFYSKYISLPFTSSATTPHPSIRENYRFWPYFKDAIGAIDGSHIPAAPPLRDRAAYRNRKGTVSQNCLFACDFGMKFSYVLTGWEGSATDARMFQEARASTLDIPHGKYFLGDAGFPSSPGVLVPYRRTRYHLAEWRQASLRPANKEELFNLRHASARNVIERIFGVIKRRFRILLLPVEYPIDIQALIPVALCVIHNIIRTLDQDLEPDTETEILASSIVQDDDRGGRGTAFDDRDDDDELEDALLLGDEDLGDLDQENLGRAIRDSIVEEMWRDYQRHLHNSG